MPKGSRISVSANERLPGADERTVPKKRSTDWADIGTTKLDISEQAIVYGSFGCREVRVQAQGASTGGTVGWSVAHLSEDGLLKLHHALGIRIWKERSR